MRRLILTALVAVPCLPWACAPEGSEPGPAPTVTAAVGSQIPMCDPSLGALSFEVDTLARNLHVPWRTVRAPDGRLFVTEQRGRILVWDPALDGLQEWAQLPVFVGGESGLMGIALHPDFAANGEVFVVGTYPRFGIVGRVFNRLVPSEDRPTLVNRVIRLTDSGSRGVDPTPIGRDLITGGLHAGAELGFGPDGLLYLSQGDGLRPPAAQDASDPRGKILRMDVSGEGAEPGDWEIWAQGLRNVQGFDWSPDDGRMYAIDHGPTGMDSEGGRVDNDELNLIRDGGNYGWPWASGAQQFEGAEPPLQVWTPASAPGALAFGSLESGKRELWIGHLKRQGVSRLLFDQNGGVCEDWALLGQFGRIRSLLPDEDGSLILTTGNRSGHIRARADDDLLLRLTVQRAPEGQP